MLLLFENRVYALGKFSGVESFITIDKQFQTEAAIAVRVSCVGGGLNMSLHSTTLCSIFLIVWDHGMSSVWL